MDGVGTNRAAGELGARAGLDLEPPGVERAVHDAGPEVAEGERRAAVGAGVLQRVDAVAPPEEGDLLARHLDEPSVAVGEIQQPCDAMTHGAAF
jgi:hypothetical protein